MLHRLLHPRRQRNGPAPATIVDSQSNQPYRHVNAEENSRPTWGLLMLPLEIRQQIWNEVLGDHEYLHIDCRHRTRQRGLDYRLFKEHPLKQEAESSLRTQRELEWYRPINLDQLIPMSPYRGPRVRRPENPRIPILSLLRSCRQIHREFQHLLYTTRTFTFSRPIALWQVGQSLNPTQRWLLQRLHLTINSRRYSVGEDGSRHLDVELFTFGLVASTIAMLYSLRSLHLCVDRYSVCTDVDEYLATGVHSLIKATKASVTVVLSGWRLTSNRRWQHRSWFKDQQTQFADNVWYAIMQPRAEMSSKKKDSMGRKVKYVLWKPVEDRDNKLWSNNKARRLVGLCCECPHCRTISGYFARSTHPKRQLF